MKTASLLGVEYLYHYQSFDEDRLSSILSDSKVYFSNPANFNDPWDCRLHYDSDLAQASVLEKHIQWYKQITQKVFPSLPPEEIDRRAEYFRKSPDEFSAKINQISHEMEGEIARRYRVYCLSSKNNDELLWAHYSNKHTGICLEFTTKSLFGAAIKVTYQTAYPQLLAPDNQDDAQYNATDT